MKFLTILLCLLLEGSLTAFTQNSNPLLTITPLTGDFYIFTTYKKISPTLTFPANGMYLVTNNGVVLFDTPWDTTQLQPLLDSIQVKHNQKVVWCFATHSHEDRTGGFDYYRKKGIKTYATVMTDSICKAHGENRPEFLLPNSKQFNIGGYSFETYYPGQGHTPDNIIIWFKKEKILYGGCLVKSTEAKDLGYTGDANLQEWPSTILAIQKKCKNPLYVIPGHQSWKQNNSLEYTLELLRKHN